MRFLFWREKSVPPSLPGSTRVWIGVVRDPDRYSYQWSVADRKGRRLNKRELHELEMRIAKYVAVQNENPPQRRETINYTVQL